MHCYNYCTRTFIFCKCQSQLYDQFIILQVNTNGVISFGSPFTHSLIISFPLSESDQIIAPYWADVDTRGTGQIFYRQSTDPNLLARASSEIQAAYPSSQNVTVTSLFITSWDAVGYFSRETDKVN